MKTGFSKICINPPYGAPITGYYERRAVKGILDDLFVRTIIFDDGTTQSAIVAVDLCYLPQEFFDKMRTVISEATGIDYKAIFINCSHTHTGPLVGKDFASEQESSEAYNSFLISCVRDSAIYAQNHLNESTFETAETQAKGVSFVRRYRMKDGSVATNPGVKHPNIDHALGEPNETVKLLKILRENDRDIYLVHFGTHPDSVGGEYISADYMGFVCKTIEQAIPDTDCIFILGFQGDVNHVNVAPTDGEAAISVIDFDSVPRSIRHAEHMGRVIAGAVLSICSITEPCEVGTIRFGNATVELPSYQQNERLEEAKAIMALYEAGRANELPYKEMELTTVVAEATRIVNLQNGPESFTFGLSAMAFGDIVFAGVGGEPFTEIGNRIREASPFKNTFLCALTNSATGYIPTTKAYSEGGYEARSSSLKPGGDEIIIEGMKNLIESL